ncbi:MAG: BrnA antitoxin family protein [Candidatus Accumulibacter sp.]|nr:BrnA antitoxin family protein [Accumulibacter sp.]
MSFPCERQNAINEKTISPDAGDPDDAPVWTADDFGGAIHRRALQAVVCKVKINIALDSDVVAWYKVQTGGRGYQTLINAALREAMQGRRFVDDLCRVIREKLGLSGWA